ncbi:MAG: hypothetical protein GPJ54_07645 [Candidatus Heimdallarchaeota archaeon]|nr:hypothetical protein [Candidatus Heimdallarchaeota archaeon]
MSPNLFSLAFSDQIRYIRVTIGYYKKRKDIDNPVTYNLVKTNWGKISFQLFLLIGSLTLVSIDSISSYQVNQEIATTHPDITVRSIVYEGDIDIISGVWLTSDSQPVADGQITVILFLNDTLVGKIKETLFTTASDGSFSLELNYTDILPGNYYWEIKFDKSGYQSWEIIEDVVLIPHAFDIRIDAAPELVKGEVFVIVAIVNYASVNSDKFGQAASNVEVIFSIELVAVDGVLTNFLKIATTNQKGVAVATLSADETRSVQEVVSITAEIQQDEQYTGVRTEMTNLPNIIDSDKSIMGRVLEFLESNTVLLAFMTVFFASSTIILLITRNKISLKEEMWPKDKK